MFLENIKFYLRSRDYIARQIVDRAPIPTPPTSLDHSKHPNLRQTKAMPPPLPSHHRGMTANPTRPARYRPGKPTAEEPSSDEDEDEEDEATIKAREEEERRKRAETQRRQRQQQQQQPKASSFPAGAITKGVKDVRIEEPEQGDEGDDEEGFVTDEDEDEQYSSGAAPPKVAPRVTGAQAPAPTAKDEDEEDEDEESEEESSEEESSEDERPRVLLRPTFIKKNQRKSDTAQDTTEADTAAEAEAQKAQRKEKADMLIREQLEKAALERSAANRQWDDDEAEVAEEAAIDDTDGLDPEAEYAAWKLRELKRVKREREAIEASEKEREEIERRRNLTAEEREREDREFLAKQKEEKDATRGQPGFMQRYFHKGAFFRDDLEREGLDQRNVMGRKFVDDVSRETLPQYMQVRDLTQVGKKGRTRYRDLRSEDTGRFGEGLDGRRRRDGPPIGITDERFMPDRGDEKTRPTGANASAVRERRRSRSMARSRSRSYSPRRGDRGDSFRPGGGRKRGLSPYEDRDKRRRTEA